MPGDASAAAVPVTPNDLRIETSGITGHATFIAGRNAAPIPVQPAAGAAAVQPEDFLDQYGRHFGVSNRDAELQKSNVVLDHFGFIHTTFEQRFQGVPVFSGLIRVHQDPSGVISAANGKFYPIPVTLSPIPTITSEVAVGIAAGKLNVANPHTELSKLVVVDPGWYGDPPRGARLAYYIILSDTVAVVRQGFFVEAHSGQVLDQWSMIHDARDRRIYNGNGGSSLPGSPARFEGQPAVASPDDVNRAYDYYGDTYDYFFRAFGRDSINGLGLPLLATVNSTAPACPNAYWDGARMVFCLGTVTDDIVAHELVHGVTQYTSGLIYQNQPGQLNEAMSDIFGELVDLFNGDAAFAGMVGGAPAWPTHPTGPGLDAPNNARTANTCTAGRMMTIHSPGDIAGDYLVGQAQFGPALTFGGVTGNIVEASPATACNSDLPLNDAQLSGNIVLIDRGICTFTEKAKNAQNAGAIAVIISNNVPGVPASLPGTDATITIPTVLVSQYHGQMLRQKLLSGPVNATLRHLGNSYVDGVRWMMGEDAAVFGGAIRDMWNPPCRAHPGDSDHPYQLCPVTDAGGVHSGSGVANHAFALMTDGGIFNGYTVDGIGPIKSGAIWYRAQTVYLTPTSDFVDAYLAINQAAIDLIGMTPNDPRTGGPSDGAITASDAANVNLALLAVGMDHPGQCGGGLDPEPPSICSARTVVFSDGFETGVNGWTLSNTPASMPEFWYQRASLPLSRPGTAWYMPDPNTGDCFFTIVRGYHILISPAIVIPSGGEQPKLAFSHYFLVENGYDGGNLWVEVNGGAPLLIPASAFEHNAYNLTLHPSNYSDNPLAGTPGFTDNARRWGRSVVDLSAFAGPNDSIRVLFVFSKDCCCGLDGWYVDDFEVFVCGGCSDPSECDDGNDCTDDTCDPDTGCVHVANSNPCDDGNACSVGDTCVDGVCFGGSEADCDDDNPCTDDACHADSGCVHVSNSAPCDDGDACTTGDVCTSGACIGGPAMSCDDTNDCTDDTCDPDAGCVHQNSPSGALCGSPVDTVCDNPDSCDGEGHCLANHEPDGSSCSDGLPCNGHETCLAGVCTPGAPPTGSCCQSNADCDDENVCNGAEMCVDHVCVPGTPLKCVDENDCTNDTCDPVQGCQYVDNDDPCDDGNPCTDNDLCQSGTCVGGSAASCDDGNPCTNDACDPEQGCLSMPNSNSCDDHNACTVADTCSEGTCTGGFPRVCDDGLFCNGVETCDPSVGCLPGVPPCDDDDDCDEANDRCGEATGPEIWMSFLEPTFVPGLGVVENEDIVAYRPASNTWAMIFDGSDVGVASLAISAFARTPDGGILIAFSTPGLVPGLIGGPQGDLVDDSDIVLFTPMSLGANTVGSFSFYFDGSDVKLTTDAERLDAIDLTPDGRLLLSTAGGFAVADLSGQDADLIVFSATSLGSHTSGTFAMYFDGSDVGLSPGAENVDAAALTPAGTILFSTAGNFSVRFLNGSNEDIPEFHPTMLGENTMGNYTLYLSLVAVGISADADVTGLEYVP